MLCQSEKDFFFKHGYLIKKDVFKPEDLDPVIKTIDDLIDKKAHELQKQGKLDVMHQDQSFEYRLNKLYETSPDCFPEFMNVLRGEGGGAFAGQSMLDTIRNPKLVDCIENLVGPDIIGSSVFRIRPKCSNFSGGEVCWHQDSGYLQPHCDDELIVTCWIPLLDVNDEMGCLYVIPDSHKGPVLDHYTGGNAHFLIIPDNELPNKEPICCEMPVGSVLFMTNKTPHASFENKSNKVRWSLDLRYQAYTVPNNIDGFYEQYPDLKKEINIPCYAPEADFIVRDSKNKNNEITDGLKFKNIREKYENKYTNIKGRGWKPYSTYTTN